MTTSRLDQLIQYHKDDPGDPFNIYALALEYQKTDTSKASEYFDLLLTDHEDYVPAYYHAAKLFADLGQREKAVHTYEKGIVTARKNNDLKAARELQSAYDELMFE